MHNEHCEIIPAAFAYRMEGAMLRTSFNPQNVRAISVPCAFLPGRTTGERRQVRDSYAGRSALGPACGFVCRPHGTASSIRVRLCLGFHRIISFTCSNPPPLVSTRAKQPISIMAGATRVSWSTVGTYFPADCHMSRKTKLNLISLFMIFYV